MSLQERYLSPFQTQLWLTRLHESSVAAGIPLSRRVEWAMLDIRSGRMPTCLTLAQLDRLLESGPALSEDPEHFAKVGMPLDVKQTNLLPPLLATTRDLRQACELFVQYIPLLHPGFRGVMRDEPDGLTYVGYIPTSWPCTHRNWYDAVILSAGLSVMRFGGIGALQCKEIILPESFKPHLESAIRALGIPCRVQLQGGGVRYPTSMLDTPMPGYVEGIEATLTQLISLLTTPQKPNICYTDLSVDALLISIENGQMADLNEVADDLSLQPRTLQNHLRAEGTSFNEIKSKVLIRLAERYLSQGQSVSEVSSRLGYSSRSAFHSAFKRLTGKTPAKSTEADIN